MIKIKKKRTLIPSEAQEQEALIRWAQYSMIGNNKVIDFLFAIPNGGFRDKRTSSGLKRQGVKPGASDLFFSYPCNGKHGLFIEMKRRRGGRLAKTQQEFIDRCNSMGYEAKVAYGWEEAVYIIQEYLDVLLVGDMLDI